MASSTDYIIPRRPKIVLFGDSLTERGMESSFGWGMHLTRRFLRRADILNRGLSGYNSKWCRALVEKNHGEYLKAELKEDKFLFSTLLLGSNDSVEPTGLQHVSVEEYEENIYRIGQQLLDLSQHGLILMTPPPVHEKTWNKNLPDNKRMNATIFKYRAAALRVAARLKGEAASGQFVETIDTWEVFLTSLSPDVLKMIQKTIPLCKQLADGTVVETKAMFPSVDMIEKLTAEKYRKGDQAPAEFAPETFAEDSDRFAVLGQIFHDGLHFGPTADFLLFSNLNEILLKKNLAVQPMEATSINAVEHDMILDVYQMSRYLSPDAVCKLAPVAVPFCNQEANRKKAIGV